MNKFDKVRTAIGWSIILGGVGTMLYNTSKYSNKNSKDYDPSKVVMYNAFGLSIGLLGVAFTHEGQISDLSERVERISNIKIKLPET